MGWKVYDALILDGHTYHRVFHSHNVLEGKAQLNGRTADKFILHLKKCESKFNNRHTNFSSNIY